jgi:hypothetical protein
MSDLSTRVDEGEMEFTPPYMFVGIYARERRQDIERPNRETIVAIFKRRDEQKKQQERDRIDYANHLIGIHSFGYCRWCGPKYFYD